ncbi:velvet factor-domain-containing protein, partial [Cerioporus squamosus]
IGGPFKFHSGPFAGRILRSALQELQKADVGRKYARKDKRPLDPPPVVRLSCFQTVHEGTRREAEKEIENFDEHSIFGFICQVDLIPTPSRSQTQSVAPADYIDRYGEPCTSLLFGETFVPCSLVQYEGRQAALFVFSDLAVRQEGRFVLRYRVCNIGGEEECTPILAECYGGSFEIFSTKTFPGLRASTDLTKVRVVFSCTAPVRDAGSHRHVFMQTLSLNGIRVNSRFRERKVRKKARHTSDSPAGETSSVARTSPGLSVGRASAKKKSSKQTILPSTQNLGRASSRPRSGLSDSYAQASRAALDAWHEKDTREAEMSSRSTSRSYSTDASWRD